jgi:hypothetical protein
MTGLTNATNTTATHQRHVKGYPLPLNKAFSIKIAEVLTTISPVIPGREVAR